MQKRTDAVRHPSEQRGEGTKAQPHAENQRRHVKKRKRKSSAKKTKKKLNHMHETTIFGDDNEKCKLANPESPERA